MHLLNFINRLFPFWVVLFALAGYLQPEAFSGLKSLIVPLLVAVMFSMGLSLNVDDYRRVLRLPRLLFIGLSLQYLIMPFAAWGLALVLRLPMELMVGMVLVGTTAGGTASNVMTYLAKGDLALSITLTLCSTLLAILLMPWLTWLYVGQRVPVPALDMLLNLVKIVLIPVVFGSLANHLFQRSIRRLEPILPLISMTAISVIVASVGALNAERFQSVGPVLVLAVMLHNGIGLFSGYGVARLLGFDTRLSRTLAIEVGMQNSGLSVALAMKFFSPLAALPGALFSVWHNVSGALFAAYWRRREGDSGKSD